METIPNYIEKYFNSWKKIDEFKDEVTVGEKLIYLAGVAWKNVEEKVATGSAASDEMLPQDRAYFELFERIIALESLQEKEFPLFDRNNSSLKKVPNHFIFPNHGDTFKYSISNGMAFHTEASLAREKARSELIERDRVLRSWYGETKPLKIQLPLHFQQKMAPLSQLYQIEAFHFTPLHTDAESLEYSVTGIFALPRNEKHPLVYGLGCHKGIEESIDHAWGECLQRMGFLINEEKITKLGEFTPTALYHQDYYLTKVGEQKIYDWLAHGNKSNLKFPKPQISQIKFADITPLSLRGSNIIVYRAIEENHIPLIFGKNYQLHNQLIPFELQIHPIV